MYSISKTNIPIKQRFLKTGFVLKKQKKIPGLFQDWLKQIPGPKIYDIMP
jgi:hypothetical protein